MISNQKIQSMIFNQKIQPIFNQTITLLFASWIDKKNPPYHSMYQVKYKFKRLYSSNRDGLVADIFHSECDHVTKTLVIAKIQNTDQIIGGFNPMNWEGKYEYKNSNNSFIFNITNKNDISTAKVSYANGNGKNAIYCYPDYLPAFGYGYDLKFNTNESVSSSPMTYDKIGIVNNSRFDELEVFEIIDKDQKIQPMIFNQKITLLFASWIDKKTPPYRSINQVKYNFKCLYSSSRDGLVADTFHSECDHVTRTLVIAKIQNTDQIIGGFNPMNWRGENGYKNSSNSFIFNITNKNGINTAKLSYANGNGKNAIHCYPDYLPVFGYGYDLKFNTNESISSSPMTYDKIGIINNSKFDELEVFEIIDKYPKIQPIFNQEITLLFGSWIDKKNPPYRLMNQVKYKFKRLYSSSRDGLVAGIFHSECDHITKTLVIAKIQNTDQIIGGFNPMNWRGKYEYKNSNNSFIFNITNKNDINTAKVSYANGNGKNAIYCFPDYLPVFGYGYDLKFNTDESISSVSWTYDQIDIVNKSRFDELEVFEIIDNDENHQNHYSPFGDLLSE
ncbi:3955_t:CDS:1 [Entrophospora sp. SA101]|nr:3955_t:CDS:1 [Entrophospora sp. SA101]